MHILKTSSAALFIFIICTIISCKDDSVLLKSKEKDEMELKLLMSDILKMSDQISCDNAADWRIVPIGAKGCGGASSFIAYSAKIDTALFLQKVEQYTQKEKAFNEKWKLYSDCALIIAPKRIECVNGKPKLVY